MRLLILFLFLIGTNVWAQPPEDRYLKQARNFFERGEYAKADMNCDAGLKRNPRSGAAYLLKAKCQYAWDHHRCNWESKKYLDSADKYSDNKYEVYLMKVINSTCCGEYAKAQFYINQLEDLEEKDEQLAFVHGYYLYATREFDQSVVKLEGVLKIAKDNTTIWNANYYLGYIHYYQNNIDKALNYFESCKKLTPSSKEINMIMGVCYNAKGDFKESLEYHDAAVEEVPKEDYDKGYYAKYFFQRGVAYLNSENEKKALNDFQIAIEAGKSDPDIHYYYGLALLESKVYCGASDQFYEAEMKIKGKENGLYYFHPSNLYFNISFVNAMANCDNVKTEHIDLAQKHYDENQSSFDLKALQVLRAAAIVQNDSGIQNQISNICKHCREGEETANDELQKLASKILKVYCE